MKRNTIIIIAMVLVAIIAIGAIITVAVSSPEDIAPAMVGDVNVTTEWPEITPKVHVSIPANLEPATKVLLIDKSVSMANFLNAASDYDVCLEFSDYLGQTGSNSMILTNLKRVLDMGVQEVGIISDLESYPESDLSALSGLRNKYKNRKIQVFIPNGTNFGLYETILTSVLEESNSTLIFYYENDRREVVFNNYCGQENKTVETDVEVPKFVPEISVVDNHKMLPGNYIPPSQMRDLWIMFIVISSIMAEIILALLIRCFGGEPEWMQRVLMTGNIALDGSASVSNSYNALVRYLRRHRRNITSVWRFADYVRIMSLEEVQNSYPGGQTHGWECLNSMHGVGIQDLTILSDLGFNDEYHYDLHFRRIVVLVPSGTGNTAVLERLRQISDSVEIYTIE